MMLNKHLEMRASDAREETKRILVTGATGKVGRTFIDQFLADPAFDAFTVRALCHNRVLEPPTSARDCDGIAGRIARMQMRRCGIRHMCCISRREGDAGIVMDVAVKGLFWLLEACRISPTFQQFILIGGDNSLATSCIRTRSPSPRPRGTLLPGLLRAIQGAGGSDSGAVLHSIWTRRVLPARPVDHGEGRFPVSAFVWRRRVWRAKMARSCGAEAADEYFTSEDCSSDARSAWACP